MVIDAQRRRRFFYVAIYVADKLGANSTEELSHEKEIQSKADEVVRFRRRRPRSYRRSPGACGFRKNCVNTIDPVASVTGNGRHLGGSGPIICNSPESAYLRVTVTQRSTGAVAEGVTLINCTDILQQWQVLASTRGNENFEPGPAIAVAIAATSLRGQTTDAHQWLVPITLVER